MSKNPDAAERVTSPDGSAKHCSDATSDVDAMSMTSSTLYDCVICGLSTPSTEENPMGLVGLLQATSG